MKTRSQIRRAFTLIELLVVVAIIALLISILLPSLARAREQAKVVKCLANLKSIGLASASYGPENNENFPWGIPTRPDDYALYNFGVFSEVIWGGGMPNLTNREFDQATGGLYLPYTANSFDVYRVPPRHRPMNKYLAPSVSWDCEPKLNGMQPREVPAETPDTFRCPSDRTPQLPDATGNNPTIEPEQPSSAVECYGNSYPINWYWPYYYMKAPPGDQPPYSTGGNQFLKIMGLLTNAANADDRTPSLGRVMMRNKDGRFASDFVMFMDNDLNYVLEGARPPSDANGTPYSGSPWGQSPPKRMVGWHGQRSKHSAGFLDGRAQNRSLNTKYIFGDGWSIWPNKPWQGTWAAFNDFAPTRE